MTFEITCLKCKSTFILDGKHIQKKERLMCPNCDAIFSCQLLEKLKTIQSAVDEAGTRVEDSVSILIQAKLKSNTLKPLKFP